MTHNEAVASGFRRYFDFRTRSSRSEYWWWYLFGIETTVVAMVLDAVLGLTVFNAIISLALLIPGIAIGVRRLHDVGRSGWWILIAFTVIGIIFPLFYWSVLRGTQGTNKYGPDPLHPQPQPQSEPSWEGATIQTIPVSVGTGPSSPGKTPAYCYQCGVGVPSEAAFCTRCGADFR